MTQPRPEIIDGLLFHLDGVVCQWVNKRIDNGMISVPARGIGILKGGHASGAAPSNIVDSIVAGAYFYNHCENIPGYDPETKEPFTWSTIECAVACDDITATTPDLIGRLLNYPFAQLGVDLIYGTMMKESIKGNAVRQAEKLGFRRFGDIPSLRPGADRVLMGLRKDWCPFWPPKQQQEAA